MCRKAFFPVVGILLLLSPGDGFGQSPELGFGGGAGKLTGGDFEGGEIGFTVGGHILFGEGAGWFGLGGDYSRFGIEETDEKLNQLNAFAIARYVFPSDWAQVFLGGKGGYIRQYAQEEDWDLSANGYGLGPLIGIRALQGGTALELEVSAVRVFMGDWSIDGETVPGSDTEGWHVVVKLGIGIPYGLMDLGS